MSNKSVQQLPIVRSPLERQGLFLPPSSPFPITSANGPPQVASYTISATLPAPEGTSSATFRPYSPVKPPIQHSPVKPPIQQFRPISNKVKRLRSQDLYRAFFKGLILGIALTLLLGSLALITLGGLIAGKVIPALNNKVKTISSLVLLISGSLGIISLGAAIGIGCSCKKSKKRIGKSSFATDITGQYPPASAYWQYPTGALSNGEEEGEVILGGQA